MFGLNKQQTQWWGKCLRSPMPRNRLAVVAGAPCPFAGTLLRGTVTGFFPVDKTKKGDHEPP